MNYWKRVDVRGLLTHKRWALPLLGTLAVAVAAYLVAMHYLFPYADLKRWVESQLKTVGVEAKLEGLGPGPFLGVQAQSLLLAPIGAPERKTEFRDVQVKMSLLSLLTFRPRVSLATDAMGGTVDARWTLGNHRSVKMEWVGVDLGRAPFLPDLAALGLRGRSTGILDAALPSQDLPGSGVSGYLQATVSDARLGPGTLGGFPLPGVSLGAGQFRFTAKQGHVEVQAARFDGGDLGASFSGSLELPPNSGPATVNGTLNLRPRGRAVEDLAFLFAFFPGGKGSDGTYTSRVAGQVGSLVLSPANATR